MERDQALRQHRDAHTGASSNGVIPIQGMSNWKLLALSPVIDPLHPRPLKGALPLTAPQINCGVQPGGRASSLAHL